MITIADIINKEINCSVTFIVNDEKENKDLLKDYDFKAVNITKDNAKEFIDKDADVHIVDILGVTEKFNDNMIIIDTHMDKKDKIIIKSDFKRREKINKQVENILVSMGGSDPDNTTEIITKSLENTDKSITIVLGPMFKHKDKIKNIATKNMTILENIKDMKTLMENADIGIASAGATLFEMISTGLPCISIAVSEQQISNTTNAGKDGYAIDIGRKPTIEKILETINKLESYETRKSIYEKQAQYKPDTEEIINEIITCLIP